MRRLQTSFVLLFGLSVLATDARGITREEVMVKARTYTYHPWHCATANLTASCDAGYQSVYFVGDFMGLPYDWGGYYTLEQFVSNMAAGDGAGSYSSDGELSCTSGLDCSGYVSKCWDTGHNTTSSIPGISTQITQQDLLPGDVYNQAGYHVMIYSHTTAGGDPVFYEAIYPNVQLNTWGGWSYVTSYIPRRYSGITGTTDTDPLGTPTNPIIIGSFPGATYVDSSRDTSQSPSDMLDQCGSTAQDESGPEYVYQVTFTQPGTVTIAVTDDANTDIDVHLYTSMNSDDCFARHDSLVTQAVDCGTYYIVADTYVGGGTEYSGAYQLTVDFTASGSTCGSGPPQYDFEGALGEPCQAASDWPCNAALGAEVCLYSSTWSYCTKACSGPNDCPEFPGGCCEDIGGGEFYCQQAQHCSTPDPDAGVGIDGSVNPGDGSVPPADGQVTDGGVLIDAAPGVDAGDTPPGTTEPGCGCRSHGGAGDQAPLVLFLVGLLLAWRRRRRA